MMYQANPVSQISAHPVIGVKMERLSGDHFPIANSDDGFGMISKYTKIPTDGNYVVVVKNGQLAFNKIQSGIMFGNGTDITYKEGNGIVIGEGSTIRFKPIGNGITFGNNSDLEFKPLGTGVMVGNGGTSISYKSGPGSDYLFNGDYEWTGTTEC